MTTTRINLVLPEPTREELERIAENHGIGVQELIRDYIGIGLQVETILENDGEVIGHIGEQEIPLATQNGIYIKKIRG